jgi:hypothetical protein
MQVNTDHLLACGTFRIGEMPLSKKIYRDTLRTLSQYSDQPISVSQNRHIKFCGSLKGVPWILTLPTSPSGQYVERSIRSKIRRLEREYN